MPQLKRTATHLIRATITVGIIAACTSAAAQTTSVKFAAFGDYGDGPGTGAVANLVNGQAPDFIVTVGDNCYDTVPIATQVGKYYGDWVSGGRFWPSLGNHEYGDPCGGGSGASGYRAYFTLPNNERYYQLRRGPVEIFAVNSASAEPNGATATSVQAQWLKSALAGSAAPWKIVYFHHSPFSSGAEHGSVTRMRWPFEAWGADAVMSGHDHDYERVMRDDDGDGNRMPYFVTGLGGQSKYATTGTIPAGSVVRYSEEFGALFATATDTALQFEFRNVRGQVIDTFAMSKSATQPPPTTEPTPAPTPTPTKPTHGKKPTKNDVRPRFDWKTCCALNSRTP